VMNFFITDSLYFLKGIFHTLLFSDVINDSLVLIRSSILSLNFLVNLMNPFNSTTLMYYAEVKLSG
jgi:hypothetical protein